MKNDIAIDITLPSNTRHLRMIGKVGEKVAKELEYPEGVRETLSGQLAIVLTEGVVNAIKHADNDDPVKEIRLQIYVSNKNLLVRIYDNGVGFDLNDVPAPCFAINNLEDKGRGIFILRSLMDSVKYIRSTGSTGGNVLEMRKKLP